MDAVVQTPPVRVRLRHPWMVLSLIALALILRVFLVFGGGQFFIPDEDRYFSSRKAVDHFKHGQWRAGFAEPFEAGDHVGFKFIGILPALIEQALGRQDAHVPALFFSLFSVLNLALIWRIAHRLGGETCGYWALFLAATSSTLFYNTRHLLPYDTSLCLALTALLLAVQPAWRGQSPAVGFVAGWAFLTYYGYWTLGGVVMTLHVLRRRRGWLDFILTGAAAAAGLAIALAIPLGLNRLGNGHMIAGARALSSTITAGDFAGHTVPWEFLWFAERAWLVLTAAAAFAIGVRLSRKGWRAWQWQDPGFFALVGLLAVWGFFIVTSTGLHTFVVHGRLIRQMTPWLALLGALELSRWGERRWQRWSLAAIGLVIALDAALRFSFPLRQEFPADFARRAEALLEQQHRQDSAEFYYRLVNVENYNYEPEVLKTAPAETLLAARHPIEYRPYIYESHSPSDRARRLAADHRMRLVKMAVPPAERVTGADHGKVTMTVRFPARRGGFAEPLLAVGPPGEGDLFFVRYMTDTRIQLSMESMSNAVFESEPITIEPGRPYRLELFSGSMLAADAAMSDALRGYTAMFAIALDARTVLTGMSLQRKAAPWEVFAGINRVRAGSALWQFSGTIDEVRRGGLPAEPPVAIDEPGYGGISLSVHPVGPAANLRQPLATCGAPGRAVLAFMRRISATSATFGVEVWGRGAWESEPVPLRSDHDFDVEISLGSLLPPLDSQQWENVPPESRAKAKGMIRIRVNGQQVFERAEATPEFTRVGVYYGLNPIGGSYVGAELTDKIVTHQRLSVPASVR